MVKYEVKVDPLKTTVIDATNPDLYGDPVSTDKKIHVGGLEFPKKGLFSFQLPDSPKFGGGVLSGANFIFNVEGLSTDIDRQDITIEKPTLEIYKMKQAGTAAGYDWSGDGDMDVVTKKIHQVSGVNSDFASVSEDFSGDQYRENDYDWEPIGKHSVIRSDKPYLDRAACQKITSGGLWYDDDKDTPISNQPTAQKLMDGYSTHDPELGDVVFLQSHKSQANGGGWWRTKRTDSSDASSAYFLKKRAGSRHDDGASVGVLWGKQIEVPTELYGDEITPENSMFYLVQGAREYIDQPTDDGDATVYAIGAVRFSTKYKLTGKQSMNMFCYWRAGEHGLYANEQDTREGVTDNPSKVQQAMVAYKNLPFPEPLVPSTIHNFQQDNGLSNDEYRDDGLDWIPRLKMSVNFEHLEMAHSYPGDADQDKHTHRRGFFVIFSNVKPESGETLDGYLCRVTTAGDGDLIHDQETDMATDGHTIAGMWIRNSTTGIRMSDIGGMERESSGTTSYWWNRWISHTGGTAGAGGASTSAYGDYHTVHATTNRNHTNIQDKQWYDFNFLFKAQQDIIYLDISDQEGTAVHMKDWGGDDDELYPLEVYGASGGKFRTTKDLTQYNDDWPAHMSIWVTNYPHTYVAPGTGNGHDWMMDNSGTMHDAMQSVYVDNIEYLGVNLDHNNATPSQNNTETRGRLTIKTGLTAPGIKDASTAGTATKFGDMELECNWFMAFGTDAATDWSGGDTNVDTNHRYLYFQDFQHPNNSIPRPIGAPAFNSPTGSGGKNVLSVGYSCFHDWLGRGGASMPSTQSRNLARMTTKDRKNEGHGGLLKNKAGWDTDIGKYTQFTYFGTGASDYDNSEDELDLNKGDEFYVNGFTQKGFCRFRIDTGMALSAEFLTSDVSTGSDTIALDIAIVDDNGHFSHSGFGDDGTNWDTGIHDGDAIRFTVPNDSNWDTTQGTFPSPLTQGTQYYADWQSGRTIKVNTDAGLEPLATVNLTGTGDSTANMMVMGGRVVEHERMENIFSSAKIIEVLYPYRTENFDPEVTRDITLKVDTTIPLRSFDDTKYMVFCRDQGRKMTGANYQHTAKTELDIEIIDNTTIKVKRWHGYCNNGDSNLLKDQQADGIDAANITRAYISPMKYWVYMIGIGEGNDDKTTYAMTTVRDNNSSSTGIRKGYSRSYSSVVLCKQFTDSDGTARSAAGVLGATYNEFISNFKTVGNIAAPRVNTWSHGLSEEPSETILDLKDYGLGPIKKQDAGNFTGGMMGVDKIQENKLNSISLHNIVEVEQYTGGEILNLMLSQPIGETIAKTVEISSTNTTEFEKPHLVAIYNDEVPEVKNFKVQPAEEDAYNPYFTWECDAEDLWYGFIIIDNQPIGHQYHGSVFHVPLNEDFSDHFEVLDYTYGTKNSYMHNNDGQVVPMGYRYYGTDPVEIPNSLQAIHATTTYGKKLRVNNTSGYSNHDTEAVAPDAFRLYDRRYGLAGHTKYFRRDISGYDYDTAVWDDYITNGSPSGTTSTGWTVGSGWSVTGGKFRYDGTTASASLKQTGFTLEANNLYQLTFEQEKAATLKMAIGDFAGTQWIQHDNEGGSDYAGKGSSIRDSSSINSMVKNDTSGIKNAFNLTTSAGALPYPQGMRVNSDEHKIYFMPVTDWTGIQFLASDDSASTDYDLDNIKLQKVQNSSFCTWRNAMGLSLDSTNKAVQQNENTFAGSVNELSVVAHVTPDAWPVADENAHSNWICAQGYGALYLSDGYGGDGPGTDVDKVSWGLFIDSDGKINGIASSLVSPYDYALNLSQLKKYIVTSKSTAPTDGTPINIIMTVDTELMHGNVKLYINGKLEDQTGLADKTYTSSDGKQTSGWELNEDAAHMRVNSAQAGEPISVSAADWTSTGHRHYFTIGAQSPSFNWYGNVRDDIHFHREHGGTGVSYDSGNRVVGSFSGDIEEVVIYNKVIYPVDPAAGEYTLTKPLPELSYDRAFNISSPLSWNAKLFVKDYHNIRGISPEEVGQSANISWAKSSFPMYTKENYSDL